MVANFNYSTGNSDVKYSGGFMVGRKTSITACGFVMVAALVLLLLAGGAGAVPVEEWNKTFGGKFSDFAMSVQQTPDDGYIIAGVKDRHFKEYSNGCDVLLSVAWLIKTDSNGDRQWDKTFGDETSGNSAFSLQQTSDGGYILAGTKNQYCEDSGYAWVIKTNFEGGLQWDKTYGTGILKSIQHTIDGGYILAGYNITYLFIGHDYNAWLIKIDSNGNKQWDKTFGKTGPDDFAESVQQTADGGYVVVGATASYGAGEKDAWIIKTDSKGTEQWNKTFGDEDRNWGDSVQQTSDNGYIIAGTKAGGASIWLIRTNSNGNKLWDETYGGRDPSEIQKTFDGGFIVAGKLDRGSSGEDAWIFKTDSNGTEQWDKSFGGIRYNGADSIQQTSDGGYIIAGHTGMYYEDKDYEAWLIKLRDPDSIPSSKTNIPGINKPAEKSAPGFELIGAMLSIVVLFLLKRKKA